MSRRAGVLLPIFSLPGQWGIGSFSKHAERFIEQLAKAGQSWWQILPTGPTGYGDSPYQSFSTFAGNPYFIDLDALVAEGLLSQQELAEMDWGAEERQIDYGALYRSRHQALRLAFDRAEGFANQAEYRQFCCDQADWLDDYALFMAIKTKYAQREWTSWPAGLRHRAPEAMARIRDEASTEIAYHCWLQWVYATQWQRLRSIARQARVGIIGDLPIYVALDSADTWSHPELFQLDEELRPLSVAGVPPDAFSASGQLWGNPLYDWPRHAIDGYSWWTRRLAHQLANADLVRLDHFRGLESYFAVPAGDSDARRGEWRKGPGLDFFNSILAQLGKLPLIAEDLGYLTPEVLELREAFGLPGMQLIQFAFDSREPADYWPHNFVRNCVVYTGTHDNNTLLGWVDELSATDREVMHHYLHNWWTPPAELAWDFITEALRSVADTCIIPMADYLGLGSEARINTPARTAGCWRWRMSEDAFTPLLIKRMNTLARLVERA